MILDTFVRGVSTCSPEIAEPTWVRHSETACGFWVITGDMFGGCAGFTAPTDWMLMLSTSQDKGYMIWQDNWTDDQEVSARMIQAECAAFADSMPTALAVRINLCDAVSETGNPGTDKISAYCIQPDYDGGGGGLIRLIRLLQGVETELATFSTNSWCSGGATWKNEDILILRAVGTTISVLREKGPRWGASEGDTDTWISVTDSFLSSGKGGWVQNRTDTITNHCSFWQDFGGTNLGSTVSGGLCGGLASASCPPGSDREEDGFEREVLSRPPTYPWSGNFDTDEITSPYTITSTAISILVPTNRFLRVRSSMVKPTRSPRGYLIWNNPEVTDDHFSEATLIHWQQPNFSNLSPTSLAVRLTPGAAWDAQGGYALQIDVSAQGNTLKLHRIDGLSLVLLGTVVDLNAAEDDVFQLTISGDFIQVLRNDVLILSFSDSTYATGKPGFAQYKAPVNWGSLGVPDSTVFQDFDNWGGGVCGIPNVALRKDLPCGCAG